MAISISDTWYIEGRTWLEERQIDEEEFASKVGGPQLEKALLTFPIEKFCELIDADRELCPDNPSGAESLNGHAKRLGVARQTIHRWKTGIASPAFNRYLRIAIRLGLAIPGFDARQSVWTSCAYLLGLIRDDLFSGTGARPSIAEVQVLFAFLLSEGSDKAHEMSDAELKDHFGRIEAAVVTASGNDSLLGKDVRSILKEWLRVFVVFVVACQTLKWNIVDGYEPE